MLKKFNALLLLFIILLITSCSSSNKLNLKIEEVNKVAATRNSIVPPVQYEKIKNIDDIGYKYQLFIHNNMLFAGNLDGEIYIINLKTKTGKELTEIDEPIESEVFANDNYIFAGTTKGNLYKIDYNGKIIWKKQLGFPIIGEISQRKGNLFVLTQNNTVNCIDSKNGTIIWKYSKGYEILSIRGNSGIMFAKDAFYAGFDDGSINKISYKGDEIWSVQLGYGSMFVDADSKPTGKNRIFASTANGYTEALSAIDGNLLWKRKISSYSNLQSNIFGLFLSDEEGNVIALDASNGETIWKRKLTKEGNIYSIYLTENSIFAMTDKGKLFVLDPISGKIMDIKDISDDFSSNFTRYKDKLYIISRDGSIYSISSKNK